LTDYLRGTGNKRRYEQAARPPLQYRFLAIFGLTNGLVALNTFDVSRDVSGLLRHWLTSLTAFQTALSADFKILLLFPRTHCFSSPATHFAWFLTALLLTELRYREADFLDILRFKHSTVGTNEQTHLPGQAACLYELDSLEDFFAKLLPTYFQIDFPHVIRNHDAYAQMCNDSFKTCCNLQPFLGYLQLRRLW
jgi:hypothetical protein